MKILMLIQAGIISLLSTWSSINLEKYQIGQLLHYYIICRNNYIFAVSSTAFVRR